MGIDPIQMEYAIDEVPTSVPMDMSEAYLIGTVEGGMRVIADRAIAILTEEPSISTGVFSIGTNSPQYDNILGDSSWGLIALGLNHVRDFPILAGGGNTESVAPETNIYLKVTKGLLDDGGEARVIMLGFMYPTS